MRWARTLATVAVLIVSLASLAGAGEITGRGSLGAALGTMKWTADDETSREAQWRPTMQGVFRYAFTPRLEAQLQSGFGWSSYALRGDTVTVVIPTTIGLNYRLNPAAQYIYRVGAGAGIYAWRVTDNAKTSYYVSPPGDPDEIVEAREGGDPGVYAEFGVERFMAEHVTASVDVAYHMIFSKNDRLRDGWKDNDAFAAARVGVHYYFSLTK
jgi:hypothetical protein